jgi:hypothetical protein
MGFQKNYRVVILVNEGYKIRECGLPKEGLWSLKI